MPEFGDLGKVKHYSVQELKELVLKTFDNYVLFVAAQKNSLGNTQFAENAYDSFEASAKAVVEKLEANEPVSDEDFLGLEQKLSELNRIIVGSGEQSGAVN